MHDTKPRMTEAQAEVAADRMIQRTLATDRAYLNATSAEKQAEREEEISKAAWADLEFRFDIN